MGARRTTRRSVGDRLERATPSGYAPRTAIELGVCAQCHARRSQISSDYVAGKPFLDHYRPALLTQPLYWSDGQQRDEVYTWGSFLESRMNAAGVTCSDCHEPHSQKLRAPGNRVCAQCHAPAKYDAATHHFHSGGPASRARATCRYALHAHRLPPRPQLAGAAAGPVGRARRAERVHVVPRRSRRTVGGEPDTAWRSGDTSAIGFQRFAAAFAAVDAGKADARQLLREVAGDTTQPAIARATALAELSGFGSRRDQRTEQRALRPEPPRSTRRAARTRARRALATFTADDALLSDSMRAVRIAATHCRPGPHSLRRSNRRRSSARRASS